MKKIFLISVIMCNTLFAQDTLTKDIKDEIVLRQSLLIEESQSGKCYIIGTVIDQSTREPIGNAKVTVLGTKFNSATSSDGQYTISTNSDGIFQLKAEAEGYEPQILNNVYFKEGKNTGGYFTLQKLSQEPADFVQVDKQPQPIQGNTPAPVYPEIARHAGIEGTVWVKMWVDKKGDVRKAVVLKSDVEVLNQPSIEAAMKWKLEPAMMKGNPVDVWVSVPFKFRLEGDVANPEDLDKQPEPQKKINPKYPESAKRLGLEGEFWVVVIVDEHGRVSKVNSKQMHVIDHKSIDVTIINPSDLKSEEASKACSEMRSAAIESAKLWKFTPGIKDGKAVKAKVIIPFKFALGDKKGEKKK